MLIHLLGALVFLAILLTAYFLIRYPHRGLKNILSVHDLGIQEGVLADLLEVIVLADHVDDPTDELRRAVEKNFKRGVKYRFIVSASKARSELTGYFQIFRTLANIVNARSTSSQPFEDLVTIQRLPDYDWLDEPHIFYKVREGDTIRYIALQGHQKGTGIANFYSYVEPAHAHMIARGIMSDAPGAIVVTREEVAQSNVVDLTRARRSS